MKNSVKKNYIYNLVHQILSMFMPFITAPYLSRVLGVENIGIQSYTMSIATYFILFGSIGISMYGQREIAYLQEKKKERTKTFLEIILLKIITMSTSLTIFYFLFAHQGIYSIYYKILIVEFVASMIDISWFFYGLEKFEKNVIISIIIKSLSAISVFIFVKTAYDLYRYFWIYVLSILIRNLTMWRDLSNYLEKIDIKKIDIFRHLRPTIVLFIPQIAINVYTVFDRTMIGFILNDMVAVGNYEQSQKIIKILLFIETSIVTVLMPRIANAFANKEIEKIKYYMDNTFRFVLALAFPMVCGIFLVSDKFIPIFFGEGYEKVSDLMKITSPILIAIGLSAIIGTQYLLPLKRQKEYTISVTAGAVVNFILNSIFIKLLNETGAAIATIIAECTVTAIQIYFVRKEIKFIDVLKNSRKYFIASIVMLCIGYFVGLILNNNIIGLLIQILISVVVYFIALVILKDSIIMDEIDKIKKYIKIY